MSKPKRKQFQMQDVPAMSTVRFVCCDCGLVHDIGLTIDPNTGSIMLAMSRNNRSTAAYRRSRNYKS